MSPDPSTFHTWTLPNGIRCVHLEDGRNVGHCGLLIEAGSRDERDDENGLAHFIEHSLFKGTAKRRTFHILNRLDSVGAELNAYTSKEETWITASYLSEHLERSVELIADNPCPTDIDGDGTTNVGDLLELLGQFSVICDN